MLVSGQVPYGDDTDHNLSKFDRFLRGMSSGETANGPFPSTRHPQKINAMTQNEKDGIRSEYEKRFRTPITTDSMADEISCYNSLQVICSNSKRALNYYCDPKDERSSVVHVIIEDAPKFGVITRLFCHTHNQVMVKWATVSWYPDAILDEKGKDVSGSPVMGYVRDLIKVGHYSNSVVDVKAIALKEYLLKRALNRISPSKI